MSEGYSGKTCEWQNEIDLKAGVKRFFRCDKIAVSYSGHWYCQAHYADHLKMVSRQDYKPQTTNVSSLLPAIKFNTVSCKGYHMGRAI